MVKNFYQPAPPIDWTKSLDNIYKEEMDALERHQAALRLNDQRRVDATITADKVADGIKNLGNLYNFSTTLAKHVDKQKQEKFEVDYGKLEEIDRKVIKDTFKTEIDLTKDSDNVLDKLRKAGVSESALSLLEKNSAGNSLRLRRIVGWESVKHSIVDLDNRIESGTPEGAALQNAYEGAYQNESVETFYRNDIYKKLNKLGFNDKYIATHFKDEIERVASTEGALASLDYKKVKFTEEIEEDRKSVQNIEFEGDVISSDSATETLRKIVKNHGKIKGAGFLHRLLKDGEINSSVIDAMQDGTITDFAAGDKGEFIFDQKTWDYIRSGATERKEFIIATKKAENESKATGLLSQLYQEDSPFKTQEQWNQAIQPLKGLVSQKTFTNLENQNLAAQGKVQTERYLNEYSTAINNGTLDKRIEDIKTIPNHAARNFLLDQAEKIKKWKEDPANEIGYDESIHQADVYSTRTENNFVKNQTVVSQTDLDITADLIAFRRQDLAKRILAQYGPNNEFTPNPNIAQENADALQTYKDANGWGVDNGSGKFSLTGNPEDKDWGNYSNFQSKGLSKKYNHNAGLTKNINATYNARIKKYPDKAKRQTTVRGVFSNDQLIGFLTTNTVSKDMQYIRAREGGNMSDLLEKAMIALTNSNDKKDKEIVERYNIKEFSETMPTPDRIISSKLTESIQLNSGNTKKEQLNLLSILKWYGPEGLSPNHMKRIYRAVDNVPSTKAVKNKAALDSKILELSNQGLSPEEIKEKLKAEKLIQSTQWTKTYG